MNSKYLISRTENQVKSIWNISNIFQCPDITDKFTGKGGDNWDGQGKPRPNYFPNVTVCTEYT